jgi:hypothetical protein
VNRIQAQSSDKKFNWGIRTGLNAISITSYKAYQADELLTNSSYTNKNGYLVSGFVRFNINRMFLQPEIAWNEYNRTYSFALPMENSSDYLPSVDLNINSKTVNPNFLIGYNIVKDYPFLFGAFAGVSAIGTYRTNYSIDTDQSFSKTGLSLNYSGILGFSINISKIYFDLRYEMSLPDTNSDMKKIPDFPDIYQNISIKKTETILSLSVGVMF